MHDDDNSSKPVGKFVFDPQPGLPILPSVLRMNLSDLDLAKQLIVEKLNALQQLGPTGTAQDEYEDRLKELEDKLSNIVTYLALFDYDDIEIRPWKH